MARLLCYVVVLVSGSNWSRHTVLCHLLPYGGRTISIFYQFIQFLGATAGGEVERCVLSPSLPSISLPIQQSTLRACFRVRLPPSYPARPLLHPTSGSRCGRPVSAKPIGKQRPKIYFPVSFPSSTNKHSNRSRKNTMRPQFLLTMIFIATAPRPPPRKFDKSQNL